MDDAKRRIGDRTRHLVHDAYSLGGSIHNERVRRLAGPRAAPGEKRAREEENEGPPSPTNSTANRAVACRPLLGTHTTARFTELLALRRPQ